MNVPKRRSARLSAEGVDENEPPAKKTRLNGAQTTSVSTKVEDGGSEIGKKRSRKKVVYDQDADGFVFSKSKRAKTTKEPAVRSTKSEKSQAAASIPTPPSPKTSANSHTVPAPSEPAPELQEEAESKTVQKKVRRRFPATPELDAAPKSVRRSKRSSNEHVSPSPHKSAHAISHANTERSPSPSRPITVEKKRRRHTEGVQEEKSMRIALPFADTPIIKRNKEMRKSSAEGFGRRTSSGMRGQRASSMIDEGRGNALPHAEVPTAEFFKHISADLTEPRRMRCLLGWCGSRELPPKPEAPKDGSKEAQAEFQALQAARVIQEELSQDLVLKGILSDWFSRDTEPQPRVTLTKKANPRNLTNAAKAEELERELERLKRERQEWDDLKKTTVLPSSPPTQRDPEALNTDEPVGGLSPMHSDLLSSPERAILEQLRAPAESSSDLNSIQERLQSVSQNLEYTVDQFAHSIHAMSTTRETADRLAERSLADAAKILDEREKTRAESGKGKVDTFDALKGLARILNGKRK